MPHICIRCHMETDVWKCKPRTLIRAKLLHSLSLSFSHSIISLQDVRLIGDQPRPASTTHVCTTSRSRYPFRYLSDISRRGHACVILIRYDFIFRLASRIGLFTLADTHLSQRTGGKKNAPSRDCDRFQVHELRASLREEKSY